jgi:hypothetical protein
MAEIVYKNRHDKFYKLNCYYIECPVCKIDVIKYNFSNHKKSKHHKMIVYCKKKMLEQNLHYENKVNNMDNLIEEIKIDM